VTIQQRNPYKYVQLRKNGRHSATFTVPAEIARGLPEHATFAIEITDAGLLYRYVGIGTKNSQTGMTAHLPFLEDQHAMEGQVPIDAPEAK